MTNDIHTAQHNGQQGEIILYQPDETVRLEVRLEDDTVWLTQQQMAELFQTTRNNVTLHIGNIFKEGELEESSVRKESLLTASDGKRYRTKFYNLDVIISVGYRVKSQRGTQFRQWANKIIKEYLLRGYTINLQLQQMEQRMDARLEAHEQNEQKRFTKIEQTLDSHQQKIDFFVRTSLPPVEGIFYDGQIFDAYAQIVGLIRQARHSIVLIDNYIDESTLTMLSKRDAGVSATIYTRPLSQQQQLDLERHNQQYPPLVMTAPHFVHSLSAFTFFSSSLGKEKASFSFALVPSSNLWKKGICYLSSFHPFPRITVLSARFRQQLLDLRGRGEEQRLNEKEQYADQ